MKKEIVSCDYCDKVLDKHDPSFDYLNSDCRRDYNGYITLSKKGSIGSVRHFCDTKCLNGFIKDADEPLIPEGITV